MTVEAALIMPMVLCVIVVLIYTAFLMYDRCLYDQDAYLLCLREAVRKDSQNELDASRVLAGERRQAGTKYVGMGARNGNAFIAGDAVHYEGSAAVLPAVFRGNALMPEGIWQIAVHTSSTREDIPLYIRRFRRTRDLLQAAVGEGQKGENR